MHSCPGRDRPEHDDPSSRRSEAPNWFFFLDCFLLVHNQKPNWNVLYLSKLKSRDRPSLCTAPAPLLPSAKIGEGMARTDSRHTGTIFFFIKWDSKYVHVIIFSSKKKKKWENAGLVRRILILITRILVLLQSVICEMVNRLRRLRQK